MRAAGRLFAAGLCLLCAGCFQLGATRVGEDQLAYSRALSDSDKRQTLLNVVRLRYGDMPTFLDMTQVISGYQLQRSVSGGFEAFPNAALSTFLSGTGSAQLQQSPTFTFQPVTGERFAKNFLRPLSLVDLLPLVEGGLPVDVLFRLGVQSIGSLQNTVALTQATTGDAAAFFTLLHALRRLQEAGLVGVRLQRDSRTGPDGKTDLGPERLFLTFAPSADPARTADLDTVRRLLALRPRTTEMEVIYGRNTGSDGKVAVLTRSMLGVLGQIAFQVNVPDADIGAGRTVASVRHTSNERRPVVVVHSDTARPKGAFSAIRYKGSWYWIADDDFDSKVAFTVVNILLALSKTSTSPSTVLTIPTR